MIVYLDASALVKRYVAERGTAEVTALIAAAAGVGTSLISRAETSAALAKAVRVGALTFEGAAAALQVFRSEWPWLIRVQATELVLARADALAWELGLRGYDAVHLASALIWQEGVGEAVTLATYDRQLWDAGHTQGLTVFPENLPAWLNA
ncbi:MAG TPA: type II toxin-antitoxin system VapC family toxin [Anaerolineae bacterium]|nr:MAG: PIN domain protein [Chloroflexi bacterium ADurb.Bin222]HOC22514.1 type II toxin-antitoxin system VapC family toxin [Anaerolineae bacterium]HQM15468.1 type II toxin-antitoxin system VapC family toxin [Anaerolineae bacterium]